MLRTGFGTNRGDSRATFGNVHAVMIESSLEHSDVTGISVP